MSESKLPDGAENLTALVLLVLGTGFSTTTLSVAVMWDKTMPMVGYAPLILAVLGAGLLQRVSQDRSQPEVTE